MWTITATDDQVRVSPVTGAVLDRGGAGVGPEAGIIALTAARNEYVSFQLVLGPLPAGRGAFALDFSDLDGPARLSRRNFEPFVPLAIRDGDEWYPEVLLPIALTDGAVPYPQRGPVAAPVPGQKFQSVWVDLFVPADAAPGEYRGRITVTAGREEREVGLRLTVLPLAIPDECSILFDLNNYAPGLSAGWPTLVEDLDRDRGALYRRVEAGFFRMAHEHRGCLHYLPYLHSGAVCPGFAPDLVGRGANRRVADWADFDRHLGGYFDGSAFSGTRRGPIPVPRFWLPLNLNWPADFANFGKRGYEAEWRAVGRQMVEHFRRKGWTRTSFDFFPNHKQRYRFYPWDCEEMRFAADNAIHYALRDLWRGTYDRPNTRPVKFAYTLGITWTYGIDTLSPMRDFIDVWITGPSATGWYHEQTADLHARGQEIWICGGAPAIHAPPLAVNWWPLQTWMKSLDGFMAWCSLVWGKDPFRAPPGGGGTTLFYPGAPFGLDGPLASQRLKVYRNAMQTIERLALAARKIGRQAVEDQVNAALGLKGLADWLHPKPEYAARKPPSEWTSEDFATERPPVAQWQSHDAQAWRAIKGIGNV